MFGNINRREKVKINHESKKGETEIVTVPSIRILRSATNFRRLYKSTNKIKSISFIYQKSDWLIALRPMVYNDWLCLTCQQIRQCVGLQRICRGLGSLAWAHSHCWLLWCFLIPKFNSFRLL